MNKSRTLTLSGTGLFLLSLFLPAYEDSVGFRCALFCAVVIQDGIEPGPVYYFA
ncbi:MAG: hypothetical protein ACI9VS_001777 [Candidatus Binatia bacterium]|jgi:hypothetical protein